jgi:hypothetical protein
VLVKLENNPAKKDCLTAIQSDKVTQFMKDYVFIMQKVGPQVFNFEDKESSEYLFKSSATLMSFARFIGAMSITMDTRQKDWHNFLANVKTTEATIFNSENLNKIANPDIKHLALGIKMVLQSFSKVSEVIESASMESYTTEIMDLADLDNGLRTMSDL